MNNNSRKVYCYYESVPGQGSAADLIQLWSASWKQQGWDPVVLGRRDAEKHPKFLPFYKRAASFPTINPPGYDLSCWLRWLAFAEAGGGVMTDYDVINRALPANQLGGPGGPVLIAEATRVPCMVLATEVGAQEIVLQMMEPLSYPVMGHFSDMLWFQRTNYPHTTTLCREIGHDHWGEAPVTHFSTGGCRRFNKMAPNKLTVIQDVLFRQ